MRSVIMLNRRWISRRWIHNKALIIGTVIGKSEQAIETETACFWSAHAKRDENIPELPAVAQQVPADDRA